MSGAIPQLVGVLAAARFNARCRGLDCHAWLTWFRTYPRGKWIAFELDPVALSSEDAPDGRRVEHYDAKDVHWIKCPNKNNFKEKK